MTHQKESYKYLLQASLPSSITLYTPCSTYKIPTREFDTNSLTPIKFVTDLNQ